MAAFHKKNLEEEVGKKSIQIEEFLRNNSEHDQEDIVKYKFLMEYGTPSEYTGGFHHYENDKTVLKVREMDKSHVQIQMNSVLVDQKLRTAIDDMYSEEGIEYQKKLLLRAIDF